jgi:hypothetical protein
MTTSAYSNVCSIVAVVLASPVAMAAEIVPVAQNRTVMGDSNIVGPPAPMQDLQEIAAPNFDLFDETLVTSASSPNGSTDVETFQQSSIDDCSLAAEGGFTSFARNSPLGVIAYSVGASVYRVTFSLNDPALCRIVGSIGAGEATHSKVILQQQSTELVNLLAASVTMPVAEQRVLAAGQYTFTLQTIGTAFVQGPGIHSAVGQYDVRMSMCFDPADLNIDGTVNIDDLLGVIGAWGPCTTPQGECLADVNLDGQVNIDDLLAVISAWGA